MRKKTVITCTFLALMSCVLLAGCKKEEPAGPVDEVLTAVDMASLQPGNFYVKSGGSFYLLPGEDKNFDLQKEVQSTDGAANGMTKQEDNRLIDFVFKDLAIPTLYKNDQLIYISDGSVSTFQWERFKDYGYSIGLSGLKLSDSGKIKSGDLTTAASRSTAEAAIASLTVPEGSDITIDKINGTALSSQYLNDGGIITGMSRDAVANVDLYIGTQHVPMTLSADTRYFKSFELYATDKYALSTDGYAIVEIPAYFKSGYYLINNTGFVKYLNVDRGVDEGGIGLDTAYYYTDESGNTLTFYEWQEKNGLSSAGTPISKQDPGETIDIKNFPERSQLTIDNTQSAMNVSVAYRYISDEYRMDANKNGKFPRVYLMDPVGNAIALSNDESRTYGQENEEGYTYLTADVDGPVAGTWYLLYENFDNTQKAASMDVSSGNATSYLHNSSSGTIDIYYDGSAQTHDITVTWEHAERAATLIKITAPDGTVYSKEKTPGNIMADEYGRFVAKLPNLTTGKYHFEIKGENLGRVWISCEESVSFDLPEAAGTDVPAETDGETASPIEGNAPVSAS